MASSTGPYTNRLARRPKSHAIAWKCPDSVQATRDAPDGLSLFLHVVLLACFLLRCVCWHVQAPLCHVARHRCQPGEPLSLINRCRPETLCIQVFAGRRGYTHHAWESLSESESTSEDEESQSEGASEGAQAPGELNPWEESVRARVKDRWGNDPDGKRPKL